MLVESPLKRERRRTTADPIIAVRWIEWIHKKQPQILRLGLLMNEAFRGSRYPTLAARQGWGTQLLWRSGRVHSGRNSRRRVKMLRMTVLVSLLGITVIAPL